MPSEPPTAGDRLLGRLAAGAGPFSFRGGVHRLLGMVPGPGAAPRPLPPPALHYPARTEWDAAVWPSPGVEAAFAPEPDDVAGGTRPLVPAAGTNRLSSGPPRTGDSPPAGPPPLPDSPAVPHEAAGAPPAAVALRIPDVPRSVPSPPASLGPRPGTAGESLALVHPARHRLPAEPPAAGASPPAPADSRHPTADARPMAREARLAPPSAATLSPAPLPGEAAEVPSIVGVAIPGATSRALPALGPGEPAVDPAGGPSLAAARPEARLHRARAEAEARDPGPEARLAPRSAEAPAPAPGARPAAALRPRPDGWATRPVDALRAAVAQREARRSAEPAAPAPAPARPLPAASAAPRAIVVRAPEPRAVPRSFWASSTLRGTHLRVLR